MNLPAASGSRVWPLAGLALLLVVALSGPVLLDPWLPGKLPFTRVLLSILPVFLLAFFLLGLTRRSFFSLVLLTAFLAWMFFVNDQKFAELKEPVVFADFLLVQQAFSGFDLLSNYVRLDLLALGVTVFLVLCIVALRWERPLFGRLPGFTLALITGVLVFSLASADRPLGSLYHSSLMVQSDWDPERNAELNGLIATLVRASSNVMFRLPEVVEGIPPAPEFLPVTDNGTSEAKDLPDVIVVLSESFFDPAIFNQVEPCQYLTEFCELQKQGVAGTLRVPTYGGNTTRTEFELLTGVAFERLGGLDYPYISVVTRPVYSLPWHLKSLGYSTLAIHANKRTFWRRGVALPRLGFDDFIALEDMKDTERVGTYVSDAVMTNEILDRLPLTPDEAPQFVLGISMENHGPWSEARLGRLPDGATDFPVPEALTEDPARAFQQYVYHAGNSVRGLKRLWDNVQQRERKTVLLFFGDHLPAMAGVFQAIGFDDGRQPWQQVTPWLLLSNFPINADFPEDLDSDQLLLQTLRASGVPLGSAYDRLSFTYGFLPQVSDDVQRKILSEYLEQLQLGVLARRVSP